MSASAEYQRHERIEVSFKTLGADVRAIMHPNQARSLYYALRDALREAGDEEV